MSGDGSVCRETTAANDCNGCHAEPRKPGQRVGKKCHAAYMRDYRKRQARRVQLSSDELQVLAAYRSARDARG